jgi:hypothetical protein
MVRSVARRWRAVPARLLAAVLASSCATPAAVRRIAAAYPSAEYEATATGCDWRVRSSGRHFGRDLRGAWLWSHQVVGAAPARRCEVRIEAVGDRGRRLVYRIVRDSLGRRTEELLPRP